MKPILKTTAGLLFFLVASGCTDGDWFGPVERGLRSGVNGWDMWETAAVRPYEDPMPPAVKGTVPTEDRHSFEAGRRALAGVPPEKKKQRAALSYRRYCHHCHGSNGDGRIIAGESHQIKPTDLRGPLVQAKSDEEFFSHLKVGGKLMIPLAATLSPLEMQLVIEHLRSLRGRPSTPYYKPRYTEPIQ